MRLRKRLADGVLSPLTITGWPTGDDMRYLIAMFWAVLFAGAATLFVASPLASWLVARFTFDNPDSVSDLHALSFLGVNVACLVLGWVFGWAVGGYITAGRQDERGPKAPPRG